MNIARHMVKEKKLLGLEQKMISFNHMYQNLILDQLIKVMILVMNYTFST